MAPISFSYALALGIVMTLPETIDISLRLESTKTEFGPFPAVEICDLTEAQSGARCDFEDIIIDHIPGEQLLYSRAIS